jgi:hypothetical protein
MGQKFPPADPIFRWNDKVIHRFYSHNYGTGIAIGDGVTKTFSPEQKQKTQLPEN